MSSAFKQEEGVPQGSILSVTCFSVAINSIVQAVAPPVGSSLFVDDFAIYVSSYDAVSACNHLSDWADKRGF